MADICKLNEDEATQIGVMLNLSLENIKKFASELIEKYQLKYCLVTFAERGAYALTASGEEAYEPGYKVKVVDPIGSGDAFSAGFMHKILRKANLQEACTYGNILGALAATKPGATYPISPVHIDEFKSYAPEFSRIEYT
jgi:fructokinase